MVAQNMKKVLKILNAMIDVRTLYGRCVSMLQQLLARHRSVMDAIKTLLEGRVDAVGTLCTRYYWQL